VLSCIILAGLLTLILIGGRKTASMPQSDHIPRVNVLRESSMLLLPHDVDETNRLPPR
jgi:hypothetical protein